MFGNSQEDRMADRPTVKVSRKKIDFTSEKPVFETVGGLIDPPVEIPIGKIPGINMVDETIICRGSLKKKD